MLPSSVKTLTSALCKTSGEIVNWPDHKPYRWGGKISIFALLMMIGVSLTRLTPLQIIKYFYRSNSYFLNKNAKEQQQSRPDFHTIFTETYFILCAIIALFMYFIGIENCIIAKALCTMLLIESCGWIFYYYYLRMIMDKNFEIYSIAEYLVSVPFLIGYQIILFSALAGVSLNSVSGAFFGYGQTQVCPYAAVVSILRTIYMSLIIGYIISMYPKPEIKKPKEDKSPH